MEKFYKVQEQIFEYIKNQHKDKKFVELLAEDLNVSVDSAYRRIRNEKVITLDEVIKLSEKYNFSLDTLMGKSKDKEQITFKFQFHDHDYCFKDYLKSILENFEIILQTNSTLLYSAKDVPIFYHMGYTNLCKFKTLYWLKTLLGQKKYSDIVFSNFDEFDEFEDLTKLIYKKFLGLKSNEIWNFETAHSALAQIEYYFNVNFITQDEALLILEEFKQQIKHLYSYAEQEQKFIPGANPTKGNSNFKLYYNEVIAADNSILARGEYLKAAFLPHLNLKYMTTLDTDYCNYMEEVFDLVMRKSTLISGVNERDRNLFFNYNLDRIDKLKTKIESKDLVNY